MYKVSLALTALVFSFAASAAPAATVHFDSGSAQMHSRPGQQVRHKHKVWVPAHRSHGRLVRGHYVWRR